MRAVRYNLQIVRGADFLQRFRFTTENQSTAVRTPINFTGWSVEAKLTDLYKTADITLTSSIDDALDGIVRVSMLSAATALLPKRNGNWRLDLISPDLFKEPYITGTAYFLTPGDEVP